jgi:hypothetical protein
MLVSEAGEGAGGGGGGFGVEAVTSEEVEVTGGEPGESPELR